MLQKFPFAKRLAALNFFQIQKGLNYFSGRRFSGIFSRYTCFKPKVISRFRMGRFNSWTVSEDRKTNRTQALKMKRSGENDTILNNGASGKKDSIFIAGFT